MIQMGVLQADVRDLSSHSSKMQSSPIDDWVNLSHALDDMDPTEYTLVSYDVDDQTTSDDSALVSGTSSEQSARLLQVIFLMFRTQMTHLKVPKASALMVVATAVALMPFFEQKAGCNKNSGKAFCFVKEDTRDDCSYIFLS